MDTFETLIFVPEGTLLNEKLAERTALRQTLKYFNHDFGPAERLKYTDLSNNFKLLTSEQRITLLVQNFLPNEPTAESHFYEQLSKQNRLIKGSLDFLDTIKGKITLALYGKENKANLLPRLKKAGIADKFEALFFADDFSAELPDKKIFTTIVQQLDCDPDTTLVVGATLSDEIQGAENANLKSLWIAPKREKIPITPHPTLHLSRLTDLLFYLNIE